MYNRVRIWSQVISFSYVFGEKCKNYVGHRISTHIVEFLAFLGLAFQILNSFRKLRWTVLISFSNTDYGSILPLKEANLILMYNCTILKKQSS